MNAVGKLGSYISKSVYTVSTPFHPFGGAVDIIVVEQQDGSFKSSPWYVRFGKFQGVLKAKEKVVKICVNGVETDFHMYLENDGQACFLSEVDVEKGYNPSSPLSWGADADGLPNSGLSMKSKSCNFDSLESISATKIDMGNGDVVVRAKSNRSGILGYVFGRKVPKEDEKGAGVRDDPLERAEIAADLLEMKWSTNCDSPKGIKDNASKGSNSKGDLKNGNKKSGLNPLGHDRTSDKLDTFVSFKESNWEGDLTNDSEKSDMNPLGHDSTLDKLDSFVSFKESNLEGDLKNYSKKSDMNPLGHDRTFDKLDSFVSFKESNSGEDLKYDGENEKSGMDPYGHDSTSSKLDSFESFKESALQDHKSAYSSLYSSQTFENAEISAAAVSIGDKSSDINSKLSTCFHDEENLESDTASSNTMIDTEAYSPPVYPHPIGCSGEEVEPRSIFAISSISNSTQEAQVEKSSTKDDRSSQRRCPLEPDRLCSFHSTVTSVSSEEEEQLLFGDLDGLSANNEKNTLCAPSDCEEKEAYDCLASGGSEGVGESHVPHCDLNSSNECAQGNQPVVADKSKLTTVASTVDIPVKCEAQLNNVPRMAISLPNMWSLDNHFPSQQVDNQPSEISKTTEDASITQEPNVRPAEPETGNLSVPIDGSGGNQKTLPFPFKKARSTNLTNLPQPSLDDNGKTGAKSLPRDISSSIGEDLPQVTKKIIKALTPTSEQLASLNLKAGKNEIIFTFSTPMLGEQKVDAQIYLWKWDMRIVISDVDGTITRSDVLGQFMPLVGVDWSQTGVVHLFSAIKENGYQMLFLSARSISQAYITRQFLVNLMQDGKGMPEGPVIISPDGLFPSLFREVVRRAPHEFKIACLEVVKMAGTHGLIVKDIKALFPSDRNPFYAGFGNRDTDEISYLKVGIPKGKIFIINPKGEIVVNRHITNMKSYTSLQALVNGMFPDFISSDQQTPTSHNALTLKLVEFLSAFFEVEKWWGASSSRAESPSLLQRIKLPATIND